MITAIPASSDAHGHSTLCFYGLVFNDNGTLRMDYAQVNDGVAFTPQTNPRIARRLARYKPFAASARVRRPK
ncbi:MAG TPA: hypothetical protein VIW68_06320 [Candidatus Sulfotelmatobacter sp.]